jgi:uncharacterized protein (UPF0264 family)
MLISHVQNIIYQHGNISPVQGDMSYKSGNISLFQMSRTVCTATVIRHNNVTHEMRS